MPNPVMLTESSPHGSRLTEAPTAGRFLLKIIDVGEGSSGYYSADTLQLAAADRVFPAGTHCYVDHAAAIRRGPNGERSIRDLAAVLTEDARYDDAIQALVAEVDLFGSDAAALKEVAPHIGVSISASAVMGPPAPGRTKPSVRRIVSAESVDFVVKAGRGGAILAVLESEAREAAAADRRDQLDRAIKNAYTDRDRDVWAGVRDFDDVARTVWFYIADDVWQQTYEIADDDQSVTLTGDRTEVRVVTTYVPIGSDGATPPKEAGTMPEITEARLAELTEAEKRVGTLESERDTLTKRAEDAEAKLAEADLRDKIAANKAEAAQRVAKAVEGEHPSIAKRVADTIAAAIEAELPADLDEQITRAIEAEKAYAASLTEGKLTGFGASTATTNTDKPAQRRTLWSK